MDGCPSHWWSRCRNRDEILDRRCPGWIEYRPGDLDAPCDTCGGRCGWRVSGPRWIDIQPLLDETRPPVVEDPTRRWLD